ncbi:uncharacterized protein BYT42DRAFT_611973 [Radiomyces spectabilis]|uniref:uncharacterized protein n=1 Tax=Radiomyces spectabilis TaxID=64574 RepID=UPI0022210A5F|nr:uncharacterized protein BYT42DRAFT_611973 [Radiomyces spectabilis]KAI8384255.1 hypothetical protein BYT42DRAFT_611973 [Radiomyces spectabilis]
MKEDEAERNVVLAIESLFPALKDLDIGHLRESELAASFVHPLIQALLAYDTEDKAARYYEVMMYDRYQPSYRTCFGELKGEGSSVTLSIVGFYRLGVFAKLEMVSSNLTGNFQPFTTPKTKNDIMTMTSILDDLLQDCRLSSHDCQVPNSKYKASNITI